MKRLVLFLALLASGCGTTPFSSQGIARVLREAAPALREAARTETRPEGQGGDVKVIVLMPEFGRPWWQMPFSLSDVGSRKVYLIVVP